MGYDGADGVMGDATDCITLSNLTVLVLKPK